MAAQMRTGRSEFGEKNAQCVSLAENGRKTPGFESSCREKIEMREFTLMAVGWSLVMLTIMLGTNWNGLPDNLGLCQRTPRLIPIRNYKLYIVKGV